MGRLARAAQTFYKERLGTGSPPHPPQCAHWGTYGLWWLRLDLTEQSPGLFDPRGEGFGGWRHSGLEPFFHKNAFQHIFLRKCVPNRSWHTGSHSPTTVPKPTTPKPSEWERAAIKPGSRGLPLVFFPPTFFKESRAPPPESAGNPRCRAHPATVPTEPPADDRGPPPGRRGNGALRPEASEKPRPPAGYAVPPPRPPAPPAGPHPVRNQQEHIV